MNNQPPRSWAASALRIALLVLATCAALNIAARLLLAALPVLLPVGASLVALVVARRLWAKHHGGW
ncbi:MAG: hypothetical protein ACYDAQ_00740 [Mycobacteriales bacterium]